MERLASVGVVVFIVLCGACFALGAMHEMEWCDAAVARSKQADAQPPQGMPIGGETTAKFTILDYDPLYVYADSTLGCYSLNTLHGCVEFEEIRLRGLADVSQWKMTRIDSGVIRHLCSSGQVCAVMGHYWLDGRPEPKDSIVVWCEPEPSLPGVDMWYFNANSHPDAYSWYRTCALCGKVESRELTKWKSVQDEKKQEQDKRLREIDEQMKKLQVERERLVGDLVEP